MKRALFIFVLLLTIPAFGIIAELDSEPFDQLDISSIKTILTDTPDGSNDMLCQAYIVLGSAADPLDGTGGAFEFIMTIGGQVVQPSPQIAIFGSEVRASIWTSQFLVPTGEAVVIQVTSPNAADTAVDITAYLYDVFPVITRSGKVTLANGPHGGPAAVLTLESMTVSNPNGDAVTFISTGSEGNGFVATGHLGGAGMLATGGADEGSGIKAVGGAGGDGIGLHGVGTGTGPGFRAAGGVSGGTGIFAQGGTDGIGMRVRGGGSEEAIGMEIFGIGGFAGLFISSESGFALDFDGDTGDINASEINLILADTTELQEDWTDGGRLDLLIDDIIDKVSAMMSKAYTLLTAVGTYDPATDSLEAQQENPQAPPIID